MEPNRIDQKVKHVETGRVGTTIRVAGIQESRVHLSNAKRLFTVQWDDTGGKQDVWSDNLIASVDVPTHCPACGVFLTSDNKLQIAAGGQSCFHR